MISSIGALNLATIERLSGHAGIISLSCRQLLAHITVIFGTLHASDVFFIENYIKEELTSFAGFSDFVSRNSLNYDILAKIPHQISEITKIQWLENSLQRCPQFDTSPSERGNPPTPASLHAPTTIWCNTYQRNTLPYHLIHPAAEGNHSVSTTPPTPTTVAKARTKNVAEADARDHPTTTAIPIATPNANVSSRHRRLTQSPQQ
jgi:hypothetical protein